MLSRVLPRYGFDVVAVSGGEEAIEKVNCENFDVILCDIMIGGIGGMETLKTLRTVDPLTDVVILTGYPNPKTAETCKNLGAFEFLSKPCQIDALCDVLKRAVQNKLSATTKQ